MLSSDCSTSGVGEGWVLQRVFHILSILFICSSPWPLSGPSCAAWVLTSEFKMTSCFVWFQALHSIA